MIKYELFDRDLVVAVIDAGCDWLGGYGNPDALKRAIVELEESFNRDIAPGTLPYSHRDPFERYETPVRDWVEWARELQPTDRTP